MIAIPNININISANVVAAYAAVLSTITGAAQLVTFLRDRVKIEISVHRGMEIIGDVRYAGITLTTVTVVNAGRRPVTITNVGAYYLHPGNAFVIADCNPPLPRELTEGKHLTAMVDETGVKFADIESWQVYDAVGRTYRLGAAPIYKRAISRMRRRLTRYKAAKKVVNKT